MVNEILQEIEPCLGWLFAVADFTQLDGSGITAKLTANDAYGLAGPRWAGIRAALVSKPLVLQLSHLVDN